MKGKIKRVFVGRGFGFIRDEYGRDIYFHRSDVKDGSFEKLKEGQQVEFEVERDPKGYRAVNIREWRRAA